MSTEVKRRRGTALEHETFTGANAEITVNSTNNSLHVHDAVTVGGHEISNDVTNNGKFKNNNHISNPQCKQLNPNAVPPSATPTDYVPGEEVYLGAFADEAIGIEGLTDIGGLKNAINGKLYFLVPNTGAIADLSTFTASYAGLDLKPKTDGVTFSLDGNNYKIEVDFSVATDVFSVKFETGAVATGHEVEVGDANTLAVIAEGSTDSRALASRFSDILNVKDFGAHSIDEVGFESFDSFPAFKAALDRLQGASGVVWVPKGTYRINGTLTASNSSIKIVGEGERQSRLYFLNAGEHVVFEAADGGYCDFSGLSDINLVNFSGSVSTALTVRGRVNDIQPVTNFTLRNVAVNGYAEVGSVGWLIYGIETSTFSNFYIQADSPVILGDVAVSGVDRSAIYDGYIFSTGARYSFSLRSTFSDVELKNIIAAKGGGFIYAYATSGGNLTAFSVDSCRYEQPINESVWAIDMDSMSNNIIINKFTSGGCNGVRCRNGVQLAITNSTLGFVYAGDSLTHAMYDVDTTQTFKLSNVDSGSAYTASVGSSMNQVYSSVTRQKNSSVSIEGLWTNDPIGSSSYGRSFNVKTLNYKLKLPAGGADHRLPIDSPINTIVTVKIDAIEASTLALSSADGRVTETETGEIGILGRGVCRPTRLADKVGLYRDGSGVWAYNTTGSDHDATISISFPVR